MGKHSVALIAFRQSDNLGIGYLASVIERAGFKPLIIDFQSEKEEILKILKKYTPLIIGFSVIYQYHLSEFVKMVNYLRINGVNCHFTAGGHYASLRFEELLKFIPAIDSIVRFDGEYTLLELVTAVSTGKDWHEITGLVYRNNGGVIVNPPRYPETDLDRIPFPKRLPPEDYLPGIQFTTIIAGRGCVHNCSFCSNRKYQEQSGGPYRRIRSPEEVGKEMEFLYKKSGCSVFLFMDDDFPVKTSQKTDWIKAFCKEINKRHLKRKILWKINCRPDEINFHDFELMKYHGLYLVFIGIDDGTDAGLIRLNKRMTAGKTLEGIDILKRLNIGFDFGFMLFQPWSDFQSVSDNLDFLEKICGDGYTPVTYLKLMPYFETRIEQELLLEGRLTGHPGFYDYDFYDDSLNRYYIYTRDLFSGWLNNPAGFANLSKWARNCVSLIDFFNLPVPSVGSIAMEIRDIIADANLYLLGIMKDLTTSFKSGSGREKTKRLDCYKEEVRLKHESYNTQILRSLNIINSYFEYNKLLKSLEN